VYGCSAGCCGFAASASAAKTLPVATLINTDKTIGENLFIAILSKLSHDVIKN